MTKAGREQTKPTVGPMALTADAPVNTPNVGKDADGYPYCTKHYARLRNVGKHGATHFACTVPDCNSKHKSTQAKGIPNHPLKCQYCSTAPLYVYLSVAEKQPSHAYTRLKCPRCQNTHDYPRPELAAMRRPVENVKYGER